MPDTMKSISASQVTKEKLDFLRERLDKGIKGKLLDHDKANLVSVSIGELHAVAEENPLHPSSKIFSKAGIGYPDAFKVFVDKTDITAVLENRHVKCIHSIEPPFRVVTKVLGEPCEHKVGILLAPKVKKTKEVISDGE